MLMLGYIGFDGKGNNLPDTIMAMMLLYVLPPTLISVLIAAVMWRFPLDETKQRELRRIIEERAAGAAIGMGTGHSLEDSAPGVNMTAKPAE